MWGYAMKDKVCEWDLRYDGGDEKSAVHSYKTSCGRFISTGNKVSTEYGFKICDKCGREIIEKM